MQIQSGSKVVHTIQINNEDSENVEVRLDSLEVSDDELMLSFLIDDPVSPRLLEISSDERFLGFELHSLEISQV